MVTFKHRRWDCPNCRQFQRHTEALSCPLRVLSRCLISCYVQKQQRRKKKKKTAEEQGWAKHGWGPPARCHQYSSPALMVMTKERFLRLLRGACVLTPPWTPGSFGKDHFWLHVCPLHHERNHFSYVDVQSICGWRSLLEDLTGLWREASKESYCTLVLY